MIMNKAKSSQNLSSIWSALYELVLFVLIVATLESIWLSNFDRISLKKRSLHLDKTTWLNKRERKKQTYQHILIIGAKYDLNYY